MTEIIIKTRKYALEYLQTTRCTELPFHNAEHTREVFLSAKMIGYYEEISDEDLEPVLLAALLHDLGNATCFKGHELVSMDIAESYLMAQGYPKGKTTTVTRCIQATHMPQRPNDILESILCDADLHHLGGTDYLAKNKALRQEWATFHDLVFTDENWRQLNIDFLQEHTFFTKYGKEILEPGKQKNLELLKNQTTNYSHG